MRLSFLLVLPILLSAACRTSEPDKPPPPLERAAPSAEHAWLQQLVGDWKVRSHASMGPDKPPIEMESTERARSMGGLWVLGESKWEMEGASFTSLMTLGYDSAEQHYVGTWVDTMQTHLWVYRGTLDEGRKKLTLEAEGPSWEDPSKLAYYRDTLEIVDANHKRMVSAVRNPDGSFTTYMQAEYVRVK
jgi:hypothetical protein